MTHLNKFRTGRGVTLILQLYMTVSGLHQAINEQEVSSPDILLRPQ